MPREMLVAGRRLTPQRRLVLDTLAATSAHPDAEQLIAMVREHEPRIAVATVYNSLRLLVEAGRIVELRGLGPKTRFDANLGDHDHFTCRVCGVVEDVPQQHPVPRRMAGRGLARYRVEEMSALLRGVCARCRHGAAAPAGRRGPAGAATRPPNTSPPSPPSAGGHPWV